MSIALFLASAAAPAAYFTGTVRNAATASSTDVQAAIDAAADLDIVLLPASGSATWSTTVSCTKAIKIDLNGSTITRNIGGSTALLDITLPATPKKCRVTNGAMAGGSTGTGFNGRYIIVSGANDGARFRIDNIDFATAGGNINIDVGDCQGGLIDHCTFTDNSANEFVHNLAYGPSDATGWGYTVTPGGEDMVFLEDNTWNWTGGDAGANAAMQNYYGARTCFRYNTVWTAVVDVHGNTPRKGRWWEFYNNIFNCDSNMSKVFQLRGGSGVVTGNVLHNFSGAAGGRSINLWNETAGHVGTSHPYQDQIGRGKDQADDPCYIWNNTVVNDGGGTAGMGIGIDDELPVSLTEDVDYILSAKPGWTAYTYPHPLQSSTE